MKPKPKSKKKVRRQSVTYTHRNSSGMPWRFAGGRPASALADATMRDCGLPLLK